MGINSNIIRNKEAKSLARENIELLELVKKNKKRHPLCTKPWTSIEERSIDGALKPCCWFNFGLGRARNLKDLIGFWFSKKMVGIRKQILANKVDSICWRYCPVLRCQFDFSKQEFYDYSESELREFDLNFLVNRKKALQAIVQSEIEVDYFPLRLKLFPTAKCNLGCVMCGLDKKLSNSKHQYSFKTLNRLGTYLEELKIFGGEPFSCQLSKKIILDPNLARQAHRAFITNGTLLTKQIIKKLSLIRIGWIDVSLDACSKKTYERIRKGAIYEKTIANLRQLLSLSDRHGVRKFDIYADFVIQQMNILEIPDFVSFCDKLGMLANFSFVNPLRYDIKFIENAEDSIKKGIERAKETSSVFALKNLKGLEEQLREFRDCL